MQWLKKLCGHLLVGTVWEHYQRQCGEVYVPEQMLQKKKKTRILVERRKFAKHAYVLSYCIRGLYKCTNVCILQNCTYWYISTYYIDTYVLVRVQSGGGRRRGLFPQTLQLPPKSLASYKRLSDNNLWFNTSDVNVRYDSPSNLFLDRTCLYLPKRETTKLFQHLHINLCLGN